MPSVIDSLGLARDAATEQHQVVTAVITSATADVALAVLRDGRTGVLPITEYYPGRRWQVGQSLTALTLDNSARPVLSLTHPELLAALLGGVSAEVREGHVRIMGVARSPGVRAKLAVAATVEGVDAVGACVGRTANRVRHLAKLCGGERVDVIPYAAEPADFLRNAFAPAAVGRIKIDGHRALVEAAAHLMSAAVGGGGLNAALAGQLVGLNVHVLPEGGIAAFEADEVRRAEVAAAALLLTPESAAAPQTVDGPALHGDGILGAEPAAGPALVTE